MTREQGQFGLKIWHDNPELSDLVGSRERQLPRQLILSSDNWQPSDLSGLLSTLKDVPIGMITVYGVSVDVLGKISRGVMGSNRKIKLAGNYPENLQSIEEDSARNTGQSVFLTDDLESPRSANLPPITELDLIICSGKTPHLNGSNPVVEQVGLFDFKKIADAIVGFSEKRPLRVASLPL
jgi:hypothetical protein